MVALTEEMEARGHEQVVFATDRSVGLRAIIAIHSTALGPSLGGIRFWHYPDEDAAVRRRVAIVGGHEPQGVGRGAAPGWRQGSGAVEDQHWPRDEPFLRALGRAVNELGGRYLAAEDVGATPADMNGLALETPWVTGVDGPGGSGDPSPVTAIGVVAAMHAVAEKLDGDRSLAGSAWSCRAPATWARTWCSCWWRRGTSVGVADIDRERVGELVSECGVDALETETVLDQPCDILAPCALGAVLDRMTVPRLRCRAVAGAANNQLLDAAADDALADRGILYVPDFVANAGGIINLYEEFTGYDRQRALERTRAIEQTMTRVFELSRELGVPPGQAAETMARRRIAEEGKGRWRPGDPAVWTNGAPLTTLRPGAPTAQAV